MSPDQIEGLIEAMARRYYVSPARITGRDKDRYSKKARKAVAEELRKAGLTSVEIGNALNRHQTTVLFILGRIGARRNARNAGKVFEVPREDAADPIGPGASSVSGTGS